MTRGILVFYPEIVNRTTVREDDPFIAPAVAQNVDQELVITAAGLPLETVIGTHHLLYVTLFNQGLESRQVGLIQITGSSFCVILMAIPFRSAMDGIVLGAGMCLEIISIIALQTFGHCYTHLGSQIGILTVGLHASAPTRVTEDVDVGCPEGQSFITVIFVVCLIMVILGTCLITDHRKSTEHRFVVKGCGHTDSLWKYGRLSGTSDTMQSLIPPVVGRDA